MQVDAIDYSFVSFEQDIKRKEGVKSKEQKQPFADVFQNRCS